MVSMKAGLATGKAGEGEERQSTLSSSHDTSGSTRRKRKGTQKQRLSGKQEPNKKSRDTHANTKHKRNAQRETTEAHRRTKKKNTRTHTRRRRKDHKREFQRLAWEAVKSEATKHEAEQ